MFIVGDKVSVIDDAMDGVVVAIKQNEVVVETLEGFTLSFKPNELVKLSNQKLDYGIAINKDVNAKKSE